MDKQEIYNDLLDEMCATGNYRKILQHPFTDGKDICSSDSHWLFRVKPKAVNLPDVPKGPKRIEVDYNVDLTLNISEIDYMVKAVDTEEEEIEISPAVTCDECNGTGEVEFEYKSKDYSSYYADCECPICKGTGDSTPARYRRTGRMIPIPLQGVLLNGVILCAYRLFVLSDICRRLDVSEIKVTALHKNKPCAFRINDDCEFVLMPLATLGDMPKYTINLSNTIEPRKMIIS